jgi:hypothetical protein
MTDHKMIRDISSDPNLSEYSVVVVDEVFTFYFILLFFLMGATGT